MHKLSLKAKRKQRAIYFYRARLITTLLFAGLIVVGFSNASKQPPPQTLDLAQIAPLPQGRKPLPAAQLSTDPWSYFHPSWTKISVWSFIPSKMDSVDSALEAPSRADSLIDDPDNKIEQEFKPSPLIRDRVRFWIDVYSRYSSRTRVVHDRANPGIVYGHMDFRPLYRSLGPTAAAEIRASAYEKKILKSLKDRLQEAAGVTHTNLLTPEEKTGLQALISKAGAMSPDGLRRLVTNVRTQTGQNDMFLSALYRSKYLLPHIESVFRQNGLPVGLARIPFVESSFNTRALSKIGAVGIWQFMPATARELIHADEEKLWADPLRQTKSAAKMLRSYRNVLPDWGMTITSYNSGVGRILRLSQKYKVTSAEDLVNMTQADALGFAGRNFYAEFLAANIVEAYKEELFGQLLHNVDSSLVFKANGALPNEACDL